MKSLVTFSLILLNLSLFLCHWSLANVYLRDVPEGHWANPAVYNLVKMGVTKGFPDGTFRGNQLMTRYEITTFLGKMGYYYNLQAGQNEKLIGELRAETATLKYQRDQDSRETKVGGEFVGRARGSTTVRRGGAMDYRLKLKVARNVDEQTGLRLSLDTLDTGYNTTQYRPLATQLFSLEGRFRLWSLNCQLVYGPGDLTHTDTFFYSENNTVFRQPKTSLTVATEIDKLSVSAGYVTRAVEPSGLINVHELTGLLKYKYDGVAVYFQPHYLYKIDGPRDIVADLGVNHLWRGFLTQLFLSVGNFSEQSRGLYARVSEKISDPWQTGTNLYLRFDKVGSKYRVDNLDKYEFVYLNNFDRLIMDGMADLGIKLEQKFGQQLSLEWSNDYVTTGTYQYGESYPGTYWLWQLTGNYYPEQNVALNAFYKAYNVPSGLAQFNDPVPTFSSILGLGVKYDF